MVDRSVAKQFEEFTGVVVDVQLEQNQIGENETAQFHITMKPEGMEIKGKTGFLHEWIRFSPQAKEDLIPEGSVMDKYLTQIELLIPEAKKAKTASEAFGLLKGRKFLFRKAKLGRSFQNQPAREYWLCVSKA